MGTLYLVATPIGNLGDMTTRAVEILQQVRLIAAEDTRQTQKLLTHFHIRNRLVSLFDQNEHLRIPYLLEELEQGDVALVSDGGTPALNDPGFEVVNAAIDSGYPVSPVPGACAPIAALVASGLPTHQFLYLGFPPRKQAERLRFFSKLLHQPYTLIFLEAPHRLCSTLEDLFATFGDRKVVIAREITKLHEEFYRDLLSKAIEYFRNNPPRGEITLVVQGASPESGRWTMEQMKTSIINLLLAGHTAREISSLLSESSGWSSREIYRLSIELKNAQK